MLSTTRSRAAEDRGPEAQVALVGAEQELVVSAGPGGEGVRVDPGRSPRARPLPGGGRAGCVPRLVRWEKIASAQTWGSELGAGRTYHRVRVRPVDSRQGPVQELGCRAPSRRGAEPIDCRVGTAPRRARCVRRWPGTGRTAGAAGRARLSTRSGRGRCTGASGSPAPEISCCCTSSWIRWVSRGGRARRRCTAARSCSVDRAARSRRGEQVRGGDGVLDGQVDPDPGDRATSRARRRRCTAGRAGATAAAGSPGPRGSRCRPRTPQRGVDPVGGKGQPAVQVGAQAPRCRRPSRRRSCPWAW